MTDLFRYIPHPRVGEREETGAPTVAAAAAQVHGEGPLARFNAKLGLKVTVVVGTMWCAYLFTALAIVSAPSAFSTGNKLIIVSWIAQTFLQLVLLPIIIVGQNIQAVASDRRSQATYDDATAILEEAKSIQAHLQAQDSAISTILQQVQTLRGAPG